MVARELVSIEFLLAALNGLDVKACDIQNAYLTTDCRERFTHCRTRVFLERGSIMVVKKALYSLKSSEVFFRALLAERFYQIGFVRSKRDLDVWLRQGVKQNGFKYWEYILCYVKDVLLYPINQQRLCKHCKKF